jgi:hypothetical protein
MSFRAMRLLVDGRRLLVFLRPPDGGAAGRRFRHRVCRSVDRTSRSAAPRRRICTTASGSAASSAAGPRGGRRRSGRRRRGWHSRRRVDRPTWRCGCRRSHRRGNWSSHRRARAAAWILFVAGRLLLPIPVRPIRRRRPSLLQLSGGPARGSANDLIRKTQAAKSTGSINLRAPAQAPSPAGASLFTSQFDVVGHEFGTDAPSLEPGGGPRAVTYGTDNLAVGGSI